MLALESDYVVRAVVRKPEQTRLKTHTKIAPYANRLQFVILSDLAKDGAFDSLLSDVSVILHVASPLMVETTDYQRDIIDPAIQMSTSILHSALKAPSVKRVIITSSMVALVPFSWLAQPDDKIYTAKDINLNPSESVSSSLEAYWNSKTFARNAVHDFIKTHSPHFDTIQLLPGAVMGPDDRASSTADLINNTPEWAFRMSPVLGTKHVNSLVDTPVDVRDVAQVHVDAIKTSIPGNQDYVVCAKIPSEDLKWNDTIEIAKKYYPEQAGSKELPLDGTLPTMKWSVDSSDTERVFGRKFRKFEEIMKDTIGQYLQFVDAERSLAAK